MAKPNESYYFVDVESFKPLATSGLHGSVHIRPVEGQNVAHTLHVECSKRLKLEYPLGTRFRIRAKLTDREGGGEYLYSNHQWPFEVIK